MSGVLAKDIIHAQSSSAPLRPMWFLFHDYATQSIVVSIRGTFSPNDIVTDLTATQVNHDGYTMHQGIYKSAQFVYQGVLEKIGSPTFRHQYECLVITGHSLGGSVASLVAWMLRRDNFPAFGFVFGAPPIGEANLTLLM